jgi:hypothetical protein
VLSIFLLIRNKPADTAIALISLAVAFMQFVEAAMWEGKGNLGARMGITALFLQPLLLGASCLYYGGYGLNATLGFALFGILVSVSLYLNMMRKEWDPPATVGSNGHLSWLFTRDIKNTTFGVFIGW